MWILVLTLMSGITSQQGSSIHSIDGFRSEAACRTAAESWLESLKKEGRTTMNSAICFQQ